MLVAETNAAAMPIPEHIAIIMDGNGRWAKKRGLPRLAGHQRGAETVRKIVKSCQALGVRYLTLYAFSSENWKRPATEVADIMGLFRLYLRRELNELHNNNVRVRFIGSRDGLADDIIDLIEKTEEKTRNNSSLNLVMAVNYGSQSEIVQAVRKIARDIEAGRLSAQDVTEECFSRYLETADIPNPDLVIRTSGEKRLSNFLLWQAAYAELEFVDVNWPEFTRECLEGVIRDYQSRERRYGATDS
ncbi:MAG: isoprenyl transferase [Rhodospirillales bacterium]|nr:isoprenyl transferase [Rhodospirillales bacterium]